MNTNSDNRGPIIGIDFGTTKTMVAEFDPVKTFAKVRKLGRSGDEMPTSMYVTDADEVFFGDDADLEGILDSSNHIRRFKMLLGKATETQFGSKTAKPTDLAAEFLSHLRGRLESEVFHRSVEQVVLTVPAMFGPAQRKDLKLAAERAGFKKVELLAEPVAAGIAYCDHHTDLSKNLRFLVVDWGGGTFDLAVVERNEAEECKVLPEYVGGASGIAGEDLDDELWVAVSKMIEDLGFKPLDLQPKHEWGKYRRELTRAKEGLSAKTNLTMSFTAEGGKLVRIPIERSKLEEVIHEKVHQGARQVAELVVRCRKNGCVPDFILLAGGTSRIPMIAILLEQVAGLPCRTWSEGRDAIALGAAIHAHRIQVGDSSLPEEVPEPVDLCPKCRNPLENGMKRCRQIDCDYVTMRGFSITESIDQVIDDSQHGLVLLITLSYKMDQNFMKELSTIASECSNKQLSKVYYGDVSSIFLFSPLEIYLSKIDLKRGGCILYKNRAIKETTIANSINNSGYRDSVERLFRNYFKMQ
jgi:molecular chaperone DnaK (HSP70)